MSFIIPVFLFKARTVPLIFAQNETKIFAQNHADSLESSQMFCMFFEKLGERANNEWDWKLN